MSKRHGHKPTGYQPTLTNINNPWKLEDYRTLASFMLYPDSRRVYRRHYELIDKLASCLYDMHEMVQSWEQPLTFHIGNRWVALGEWNRHVNASKQRQVDEDAKGPDQGTT